MSDFSTARDKLRNNRLVEKIILLKEEIRRLQFNNRALKADIKELEKNKKLLENIYLEKIVKGVK